MGRTLCPGNVGEVPLYVIMNQQPGRLFYDISRWLWWWWWWWRWWWKRWRRVPRRRTNNC